MSRKHLITVAICMAHALGVREHAWKLSDKTGVSEQAQKEDLHKYAQLAFDMVEVGEGIAMQKPENVNRDVYYEFADDYAIFIRGNQELPTEEQGKEILVRVVMNAFRSLLNRDQLNQLEAKLKEL